MLLLPEAEFNVDFNSTHYYEYMPTRRLNIHWKSLPFSPSNLVE